MTRTAINFSGLAISALASAWLTLATSGQTALAAEPLAPKLIDKPFEECLIKHFQVRFFNRIDASESQRQKLSALIARRVEETRPLREQLRQEVLELNALMASAAATDEQLTEKAHAVRDIRNQVMDERLKSVLALRAVLTPGQRQQVSDRIAGLIAGQWKPHALRSD